MTLPPMEELPEGWVIDEMAVTAPCGYKWSNNGKSRFANDYQQALVRIDKEECDGEKG